MKNYFEDIYQAALVAESDYVTSYQLVNSIYQISKTVDVHSPIYKCVPSYKLALEGKRKSVELLMRFGTDLNHVVSGAACGGNEDWAMNLCITHNVNTALIKDGLTARNLEVEMDKDKSEEKPQILTLYLIHAAVQSSDYFLIKYFLKNYIIPLLETADQSSENPYPNFDYLYDYINHPNKTDTPVISTEPVSSVLYQEDHASENDLDADLMRELTTQVERIFKCSVKFSYRRFLSKYLYGICALLARDYYIDEWMSFTRSYQTLFLISNLIGYNFRAASLEVQDFGEFYPVNIIWEFAQKATAGRLRYSSKLFVNFHADNYVITENFAFWGFFTEAEALRQNDLTLTSSCIEGAIKGGHFHYANALLSINPAEYFPTWYFSVIQNKQFKFIVADSFELSCIISQSKIRKDVNPYSIYSLVGMLNNSPYFNSTANMAVLKKFMFNVKIPSRYRPLEYNYFQLRAYAKPEIILWFHHGHQLKQLGKSAFNLPQEVFDLITSFLSPMLPHEASSFFGTYPKYLGKIKRRCDKTTLKSIKQLIRKYAENPTIFKPERFHEFNERYQNTYNLKGLGELLSTELKFTSPVNYPYTDYHQLIVVCCLLVKKQLPKYPFNSLLLDPKIETKQYDVRNDTEEYRRVFIENYLQEYNSSFFKNPFSSMLKQIKDNTVTNHLIQQHARNNPDSRTRQIVNVMEAQGKDLPQINRFKQEYLADYHSKFFRNPFSTGRKNLSSITSVKQIIKYSESNPDSRTASILKRN